MTNRLPLQNTPVITNQKQELRLAMIGSSSGNGHPYSWSAIFNGYDRPRMTAECPFPGIPAYLNKEPSDSFGIDGAKVTHICCVGDGGFTAEHVAQCSLIPNVVADPRDIIGAVDAVIIATDAGHEHVARARPFVEAGIPLFIDKPMVDDLDDLHTFTRWVNQGHAILSSSCMRYTKEYLPYHLSTNDLGELRFATITTPKSWERYGIHALEGVYPIVGPGFTSIRNTGTADRNIIHLKHSKGVDVVVAAIDDMFGSFGCLQLCGTAGHTQLVFKDSFYAFKAQLVDFIKYLRTGTLPFPYAETFELMQLVIGAIISRNENGREVQLEELI